MTNKNVVKQAIQWLVAVLAGILIIGICSANEVQAATRKKIAYNLDNKPACKVLKVHKLNKARRVRIYVSRKSVARVRYHNYKREGVRQVEIYGKRKGTANVTVKLIFKSGKSRKYRYKLYVWKDKKPAFLSKKTKRTVKENRKTQEFVEQMSKSTRRNANKKAVKSVKKKEGIIRDKAKAIKAKYSYEIEILNKQELYYDHTYLILHIITDNPGSTYKDFHLEGAYIGVDTSYDDIQYADRASDLDPVTDGYILTIYFTESGKQTLTVYEKNQKTTKKFDFNILDDEQAESEWIDRTISEVTTDDMSGEEKMDSLCSFVKQNFSYYHNKDGNIVWLTTDVGPWWVVQRIDCIEATDIMIMFANRLGYEVESTYAGYLNHHYATVIIDGERIKEDACPYSSEAYIDSWEYVL